MQQYQRDLIDLLVRADVLQFGSFTTKAGRPSPYFLNFGKICRGSQVAALGRFYALHLLQQQLGSIDLIFGPAYKGIPLAVATAASLSQEFNRDVAFVFDRKEEKQHGDKGRFVGLTPQK